MYQHTEMVSEMRKTLRAAFLSIFTLPLPDYPPGIVKTAANVMVAMSPATNDMFSTYFSSSGPSLPSLLRWAVFMMMLFFLLSPLLQYLSNNKWNYAAWHIKHVSKRNHYGIKWNYFNRYVNFQCFLWFSHSWHCLSWGEKAWRVEASYEVTDIF